MKYCSIASGSNGNCYFVAKEDTAVLIDAGINNKHMHLRMNSLGIIPTQIKAIFITHEHTDHVCGLRVFAKKYNLPVYITRGTYEACRFDLPEHLLHFIEINERIRIESLEVIAIPKYHDAKEPCSFVVSDGRHNISILTDLGRGCDNVKHVIQHSDVLLLESNFDEDMLRVGSYPYHLKNRIQGGWGHISNRTALTLFLENRTPRLRHLLLGHLSGQNNTEHKVWETFEPHTQHVVLSIATRHSHSELFDLRDLSVCLYTDSQADTLTKAISLQGKAV